MSQDKQLTDLTELTTPADGDYVYVVDVSDTTDDAAGSSRKVQLSNARGWPQTSAESSAGIVPTNLGYEPGNVLRYGAAGDGVTDDTTAISNALNSGEGRIYAPAGTYKLTSEITLPSNITVKCDEAAIFAFSGSMSTATVFTASSKSRIRWFGGQITGDQTADGTTRSDGGAFDFTSCTDITVSGVDISGFPRFGIYLKDTTNYEISKNYIDDIASVSSDTGQVAGLSIEDASDDGFISENIITNIGNNASDYGGFGIRIIEYTASGGKDGAAKNVHVVNNKLENIQEHGIVWYSNAGSPTGSAVEDCICSGNRIRNVGRKVGAVAGDHGRGSGIYLQQISGVQIVNNHIRQAAINSVREQIGLGGIVVVGPFNLTGGDDDLDPTVIVGNTVYDCPHVGIWAQGVKGLVIGSNHLKNICTFVGPDGNWTNSTAYSSGDIVVDSSKAYVATSSGTSNGTNPTDDVGVSWTLLGTQNLDGVRMLGCSEYTCTGNVVQEGTASTADVTTNGWVLSNNSSTPCTHGAMSANVIKGFNKSMSLVDCEDLSISGGSCLGFDTWGIYVATTGTRIKISDIVFDVADASPLFETESAGTYADCEISDCVMPDSSSGNGPRIRNRTTGFAIRVRSDSVPNHGTWSTGDMVYLNTFTAGSAPGYVCTTAGAPGTWKAMASVAA